MYSIPLFLLTKELKEQNLFTKSDIENHQYFCRLFSKAQTSFDSKIEESKSQKGQKTAKKDKDLQNKVWLWFDNLNLEQKLKICTIKNKWLLKLIIQLFYINCIDNKTTFEPTSEMGSLFSCQQNFAYLCQNIKIFSNTKNTNNYIGYSGDDYYDLYFKMKKAEFKKKNDVPPKEEIDDENTLINNIIAFSIEEEDSLDSFTLDEELLKDSKKLKSILYSFSGEKCFKEWISPLNYNNFLIFCYPIWMHNKDELSFCQFISGIFEQQILIAYEYYYYTKKIFYFPKIESILDIYKENENLENYFSNREKKEKVITLELINEKVNSIKSNVKYKKKIQNYKKMFDQISKDYHKTEFYVGDKIWDNQGEVIYNELKEEINQNESKGKEIHYLLNKITFIKLNDIRIYREFIYYKLKKHFIEIRDKEIIDDLLNNNFENKEGKKKKKKKKKNKNNNINNNTNNISNKEENKIIINEKNFSSNDENENSTTNINSASASSKSLKMKENKEPKNNSNTKEEKIKTKEFFLFPINNKKNKNKMKNKDNNEDITNITNEKSLSEKNNIKINYKETEEEKSLIIVNDSKIINNKSKSKTDMTQLSETSIIQFEMLKSENNKKGEEEQKQNKQYYLNSPESTTSFSFEAVSKEKKNELQEIINQKKENKEYQDNNKNENKNQINMTINIINNQYIYPQFPLFNFNIDNFALMQSQFLYYYHVPSQNFFDALSKEIKVYENFTSKNIEILNKIRSKYLIKVEKMIESGLNKKYKIKFGHYGSFFTNLSIEGSDVDILVYYKPLEPNLDFLKDIINLLNENEEEFESINPRLSASVPVIVLQINISEEIDNKTLKFLPYFETKDISHINIDLTFTSDEKEYKRPGQIVNYINASLKKYEEIRPLLLVIKRYFRVMKMNKSFTGGLSSYSLFLLILAFLKSNEQQLSLSKALYYFMEKYSIFDFKNFGIDVEEKECYFPLDDFENSNNNNQEIQNIVDIDNIVENNRIEEIKIIDPFTKLNVAKSSFRLDEIKITFNKALYFLKYESWKFQNDTVNDNKEITDDFTIIKKLFNIK